MVESRKLYQMIKFSSSRKFYLAVSRSWKFSSQLRFVEPRKTWMPIYFQLNKQHLPFQRGYSKEALPRLPPTSICVELTNRRKTWRQSLKKLALRGTPLSPSLAFRCQNLSRSPRATTTPPHRLVLQRKKKKTKACLSRKTSLRTWSLATTLSLVVMVQSQAQMLMSSKTLININKTSQLSLSSQLSQERSRKKQKRVRKSVSTCSQ